MLNGKTYDVVVVGGGVVGLWVARHAVKAGLTVALVDKNRCGTGASSTVLGALLPHLPRVMSAKKVFQFEALAELSALIAELEDETGYDAGYARCGRIMPIRTRRYLEHAERASTGSIDGWRAPGTQFSVEIHETDKANGWLCPDAAPLGMIHDNLSARVLAENYTAALKASLQGSATLIEGEEVTSVDTQTRQLIGTQGSIGLSAKDIVFAAGHETFPLVSNQLGLNLGAGVKGQAAVFEIQPDHALPPIIYDNGVYVVPHGPGRCAVGSTSEEVFDHPTQPDPTRASDFITRAKALCPPLRDGRLTRHWAGVRPRCAAKDPIVGCLDTKSGIHIATGGYKITFGIAHRLARRLVEELIQSETRTVVPETYEVGYHLQV